MTKLSNPVPIFLDGRGTLLDAGYIYVGQPYTDAEDPLNQIPIFWDKDLTIPAAQPLRTLGGVITNGGNDGFVFFTEGDYSLVIRDVNNVLVAMVPSTEEAASAAYQPLNAELTAISALTTTAYGRNLLTLADQAALKAATGIPDSLPLSGGAMTGPISRVGAGVFTYHVNPAMTSGRIFLTASGDGDPTSLAGDIWLTY